MKSPLRYPGGKTRAIVSLEYILNTYYHTDASSTKLISPFCGGCSFEFAIHNRFNQLILNDKFEPLINFFNQCKSNKDELVKELRELIGTITKDVFSEYRRTVIDDDDALRRAVKYFVINRCSFSGATLSGGFSEEASNKRFTNSSIDTIERLDLTNIIFYNEDFTTFIDNCALETECIMFCDPPYMLNGSKNKLYGENGDLHEHFNHEEFYKSITTIKHDWIITYNDSPKIRELYKDFTIIPASWAYGMNASKRSSEIIILSKSLPKGGIPHISGNIYEVETLRYLQDMGFTCERHGGSSKCADIIANGVVVECKNSLKGVDYNEFKLELVDSKYICSNETVNKYIPKDLFQSKPVPTGISSVEWNKIKRPAFADVYITADDLLLSQVIDAKYVFINGVGKFKTSDDDPLDLKLTLFNYKLKLRLYVKNHSSSKAQRCNLSAVATVRVL